MQIASLVLCIYFFFFSKVHYAFHLPIRCNCRMNVVVCAHEFKQPKKKNVHAPFYYYTIRLFFFGFTPQFDENKSESQQWNASIDHQVLFFYFLILIKINLSKRTCKISISSQVNRSSVIWHTENCSDFVVKTEPKKKNWTNIMFRWLNYIRCDQKVIIYLFIFFSEEQKITTNNFF